MINMENIKIDMHSYITALEEQNKQLLDEIERLKTKNRILTDELEDLDKQFIKTKEWNLEVVYSNKFKDNEIDMLKFQLKTADSVNATLSNIVKDVYKKCNGVEDRRIYLLIEERLESNDLIDIILK